MSNFISDQEAMREFADNLWRQDHDGIVKRPVQVVMNPHLQVARVLHVLPDQFFYMLVLFLAGLELDATEIRQFVFGQLPTFYDGLHYLVFLYVLENLIGMQSLLGTDGKLHHTSQQDKQTNPFHLK